MTDATTKAGNQWRLCVTPEIQPPCLRNLTGPKLLITSPKKEGTKEDPTLLHLSISFDWKLCERICKGFFFFFFFFFFFLIRQKYSCAVSEAYAPKVECMLVLYLRSVGGYYFGLLPIHAIAKFTLLGIGLDILVLHAIGNFIL